MLLAPPLPLLPLSARISLPSCACKDRHISIVLECTSVADMARIAIQTHLPSSIIERVVSELELGCTDGPFVLQEINHEQISRSPNVR
jgi:hypothetical protein